MINVYNDTIIYVLCPAYSKTGGPELLHQLVYQMNLLGYRAYITYFNYNKNDINYTNENYKKYVNEYKLFDDIIDSEKNILIIPEIYIKETSKLKKVRKCMWWLSVDNFKIAYEFKYSLKYKKLLKTLKKLLKGDFLRFNLKKIDYHLCQSYYAIDYLKSKKIDKSYYLSDYLNEEYLKKFSVKTRKKVVLYNPKKGYEFTKLIIESMPTVKFIPLINLTVKEVHDLLSESMLYIDFGNHPGKDRFPREAAISGCCVITGKRGSANYSKDVVILDEFKFNDDKNNISNIINKIQYVLDNYDKEVVKFENYRNYIRQEEENFKKDILKIFIKD